MSTRIDSAKQFAERMGRSDAPTLRGAMWADVLSFIGGTAFIGRMRTQRAFESQRSFSNVESGQWLILNLEAMKP